MIRITIKTQIKEKYRSIDRSRVRSVIHNCRNEFKFATYIFRLFFFFIKGCFPCDGLRLHFFFSRETNARVDGNRGSIEPTRHGVFIHRYKYE